MFSESEHVSPPQNTFFRYFSGVRSSEFPKKRVTESEHVFPIENTFVRCLSDFRASEFQKNVFGGEHVFSEPEHVSPTQNTFLRNFRSSEFGVSQKRVLSGNTFLRLRTRFSEIFGVRSSEFRKNLF